MRLVLATNNKGKVRELKELLNDIEVLSLADFPQIPEIIEDGTTFAENAVKKAREIARITESIALADDSGLEVDYLDGQPGIYSARFAGEEKDDSKNNAKLLELLKGVPESKRTARFRCVIAIATPLGETYTAEGTCEGSILSAPEGNDGFGYDPLFYVPEYDKTFAQLDMNIKNKISHRGIALNKAKDILMEILKVC